MTDHTGSAAAATAHPDAPLLAGYAAGAADRLAAWSVEAHLINCAQCRSAVSAHVDQARLSRNRQVMLVRAATADRGPAHRVLTRFGVPDHVLQLLAATPSLRLSWLLSVLGALVVVTGEAALAAAASGRPGAAYQGGQLLLPFVLVTPLLVLAAVTGAFLPLFDPAYRLTVAAPFSGLTLLLVRAISALTAALVPVVIAAFVVPGPGWLPAAMLLPSLSLSALALATSAVLRSPAAVVTVGALWAVSVLWVAAARSPLLVLHWHGQAACSAVLLIAVAVLAGRRDRLEIGWMR